MLVVRRCWKRMRTKKERMKWFNNLIEWCKQKVNFACFSPHFIVMSMNACWYIKRVCVFCLWVVLNDSMFNAQHTTISFDANRAIRLSKNEDRNKHSILCYGIFLLNCCYGENQLKLYIRVWCKWAYLYNSLLSRPLAKWDRTMKPYNFLQHIFYFSFFLCETKKSNQIKSVDHPQNGMDDHLERT